MHEEKFLLNGVLSDDRIRGQTKKGNCLGFGVKTLWFFFSCVLLATYLSPGEGVMSLLVAHLILPHKQTRHRLSYKTFFSVFFF